MQSGMVSALVGNGKELLFEQSGIAVLSNDLIEQGAFWIWIIALLLLILFGKNTHEIVAEKRVNKAYRIALVLIMLVSVISISGVSKFLYFNF